jgi:hypothetical protein
MSGAGNVMPDNAFIEAFNGGFRTECLNTHRFTSLADAQKNTEDWPVLQRGTPLWGISQRSPIVLLNYDRPTLVKKPENSNLWQAKIQGQRSCSRDSNRC